jgi:hypothetical protein
MQFFKPENYFEVRQALIEAGRTDLIGDGCDALIPSRPPKEALIRRRKEANSQFRGEYVHTISGAGKKKKRNKKQSRHAPGQGYRPARKEAKAAKRDKSG